MQTVNFPCSFCSKPMAVGLNLLGRNVRCPHCKQVVQAPVSANAPVAAPPPPPPPPPPQPPPPTPKVDGQESIFGDAPDDDVFSTNAPPPPMKFNPPPTYPAPRTESGTGATEQAPAVNSFPAPIDFGANRSGGIDLPDEDRDELDNRAERRPTPHVVVRQGGGMFVWMLLLYAVIATGIAAYLFYNKTQKEAEQQVAGEGKASPYMAIPDFFGEYDRAERKKAAKIEGMPAGNLPVPDALKVKLNETLQVGSLEVTPLSVEYTKVNRFRRSENDRLYRESPGFVYLLRVKLKNTSDDTTFHPTDPAFNRHLLSKPVGLPIYNGVEVERNFTMGGPFAWPDDTGEYVDGQKDDIKPLAPGEEREYVVVSSFNANEIEKHLKNAKDTLATWRVQLRRGVEAAKDGDGNDRDISMTSVIGVVFDRQEILY